MCENARKCEICGSNEGVIAFKKVESEGELKGMWLCESCEETETIRENKNAEKEENTEEKKF